MPCVLLLLNAKQFSPFWREKDQSRIPPKVHNEEDRDRAVQGGEVQDGVVHGEDVHDAVAHGREVHDRAVHGEDAHNAVAHGREVHDRAVHSEEVVHDHLGSILSTAVNVQGKRLNSEYSPVKCLAFSSP